MIMERALRSEAFRESLVRSPKEAIEAEFGFTIPDDVTINIHQNTPNEIHLVLPLPLEPSTLRRLTQEELHHVAGGDSSRPVDFVTSPCTDTHCFAEAVEA
jgi:hypothetical protein